MNYTYNVKNIKKIEKNIKSGKNEKILLPRVKCFYHGARVSRRERVVETIECVK